MQLGMVGLGRMGAGMVRRVMRARHTAVVHDLDAKAVHALQQAGATGAHSLHEFVAQLERPRVVWLMLPAAAVEALIEQLVPLLEAGDIVVDGGNSHYVDDLRRSKTLAQHGLHFVDVGTSGGVWGMERGFCLMIGGPAEAVSHLDPLFQALAPGINPAEAGSHTIGSRTIGSQTSASTAHQGYLHCGPSGAGHFVKMVHNGIEYGLMAAYAEGLNILHHANVGSRGHEADAETTPLRDPERYRYDFDIAAITETWRRGSVISSWLLDLTASALAGDPALSRFQGRVSDSGEGRWTLAAAIDEGVPAPVLSAALYERFASRGQADFANRVLSAMRFAFGGHVEKPVQK